MDFFLQDVRHGFRSMMRNPAVTAVAVVALALGIGANSAIFSVVNGVLLRPLPYKHSGRLVVFREKKLPQFPDFSVAPGNYLEWKAQSTVFDEMAAYRFSSLNLTGAGEPERIPGVRVSPALFALLGVQPSLGRDFRPEEGEQGKNNVVVLSHGLWQRRFGSGQDILGKTLVLSGGTYRVVGVMPEGFQFPGRETEMWIPLVFSAEERTTHGAHYLNAIARVKQGISLERARAEMDTIARRLQQQFPGEDAGWEVTVSPMLEYTVGDLRPALLILLGAVALVLLIACANVANLLLARAASRQKEIALRSALGASRWRIARQMLTESLLLSLFGGALGLALAYWGLRVLLALTPADLPRIADVSRALGFTALVALATGALFGLAPALQACRVDLNQSLKKEGGRSSGAGSGRHRLRGALVVSEVALALVLLIGAGLLMKSFGRLTEVNPGFNPHNLLIANIVLPQSKYSEHSQRAAFFEQLIAKIESLPGVAAAGITQSMPFTGDHVESFTIEGRPPLPRGEFLRSNFYAVSLDYFRAMGIPLMKGRFFTLSDGKDAPPVAVINESLAKHYFPNEDPIGKRIKLSSDSNLYREIVGIAGDVKHYSLDSETPDQNYVPYAQDSYGFVTLAVRTAADPKSFASALRGQVGSIDKDLPVASIMTMEKVLSDAVARQRFSMILLTVFAAAALALAGVGLYGVMSYSAAQRTHEVGVRMALGAGQRHVLRLIVGHGLALALAGVGCGLVAAFALSRLLSTMQFGVSAADPVTFAAASMFLVSVAVLASYLPARRASRVDPMVALREE